MTNYWNIFIWTWLGIKTFTSPYYVTLMSRWNRKKASYQLLWSMQGVNFHQCLSFMKIAWRDLIISTNRKHKQFNGECKSWKITRQFWKYDFDRERKMYLSWCQFAFLQRIIESIFRYSVRCIVMYNNESHTIVIRCSFGGNAVSYNLVQFCKKK